MAHFKESVLDFVFQSDSVNASETGVELCLDQSDTQSQNNGEQVRASGIEKATPSIVMPKAASGTIQICGLAIYTCTSPVFVYIPSKFIVVYTVVTVDE